MKYLFAFLIAASLIGGMFAFRSYMITQEIRWEAANADLTGLQVLACSLAHAIGRYWYLFAFIIALVCCCTAALIPKRHVAGRPK